ncbi:hypothetical protein ABEB36_003975 [Hypothenemus hampei]|uniref:Tyr recombinase domain-containing protein n=1 Tax=Hypothenemus hampei TaxID=57062 RepID=A0ABD1F1S9_HYPHA
MDEEVDVKCEPLWMAVPESYSASQKAKASKTDDSCSDEESLGKKEALTKSQSCDIEEVKCEPNFSEEESELSPHSVEYQSEIDDELDSTAPEITQKTDSRKKEVLLGRTKGRYESAYKKFKDWTTSHGIRVLSEDVLLRYFENLSKTYRPSTLWSLYSMLNSTIKQFENIDIEKYAELMAFLRRKNLGYKSEKCKVFETNEIKKFLQEAPDDRYLLMKVAMIFGVAGGCRGNELPYVSVNDIQEQGRLLLVDIPESKTNIPRSFIICDPFVDYVKKYASLRPVNAPTDRFFLNYQKGRCTIQVVGKNKFCGMPKKIATFLGLDEPRLYTGRSFRRTSATLLGKSGQRTTRTLHIQGEWKSSKVAEGYVINPLHLKNKTETVTMNEVDSAQDNIVDDPEAKRQKTLETVTTTSVEEKANDDVKSTSEYTITTNNSQTCTINNKNKNLIINIQNCDVYIHNYK